MSKIQNWPLVSKIQIPKSASSVQLVFAILGSVEVGEGVLLWCLTDIWEHSRLFLSLSFFFLKRGVHCAQEPPPLPPRYLTLKDIPSRNYRLFFLVRLTRGVKIFSLR